MNSPGQANLVWVLPSLPPCSCLGSSDKPTYRIGTNRKSTFIQLVCTGCGKIISSMNISEIRVRTHIENKQKHEPPRRPYEITLRDKNILKGLGISSDEVVSS